MRRYHFFSGMCGATFSNRVQAQAASSSARAAMASTTSIVLGAVYHTCARPVLLTSHGAGCVYQPTSAIFLGQPTGRNLTLTLTPDPNPNPNKPISPCPTTLTLNPTVRDLVTETTSRSFEKDPTTGLFLCEPARVRANMLKFLCCFFRASCV